MFKPGLAVVFFYRHSCLLNLYHLPASFTKKKALWLSGVSQSWFAQQHIKGIKTYGSSKWQGKLRQFSRVGISAHACLVMHRTCLRAQNPRNIKIGQKWVKNRFWGLPETLRSLLLSPYWEKKETIHHLAPVKNFSLPKKRWGPQRKDFGGRYGFFLVFTGFLYLPPAWQVFEATKVYQIILFRWW